MKKQRDPWWGYIKQILYRYPNGADFEKAAIQAATESTKRRENGDQRLEIVKLVFFDKTHKLAGAAMKIPCGYSTAKRWQQDYIREVAKNFKCDGLTKS